MSAIRVRASCLSGLAAACFLILAIGSCQPERGDSNDPNDANTPTEPNETREPQFVRKGSALTPTGKVPAAIYSVWNPDAREFEEKALVPSPASTRHDGLASGAKAAATSIGGGAPNGQNRLLPNAALFAGGIGKSPEFTYSTPQAYFYNFTTDEWTGLEMGSARRGHTLTTLLDGRILIIGGWDGARVPNARGGLNEPAVSSTELFDPSDLTFRPGGALLWARRFHAAARLIDGRVLVVGGGSGNFEIDDDQVRDVEIYDPATNLFAAAGELPVAVDAALATTLNDGRVLVVGDNQLTTAQVFDPATGTFSAVGDMTAIHGFGLTATKLKNGQVLILGGRGDGRGVNPTDAAELFDPVQNTFAAITPMRIARDSHVAILQDDGSVLVVGGNIVEFSSSGSVTFTQTALSDSFDPTTNTFSLLPDAPTISSGGDGVYLERE